MIATWIPDTTNLRPFFCCLLVIESRMSGGPSPSHVAEVRQEMPRWVNSSAARSAAHG